MNVSRLRRALVWLVVAGVLVRCDGGNGDPVDASPKDHAPQEITDAAPNPDDAHAEEITDTAPPGGDVPPGEIVSDQSDPSDVAAPDLVDVSPPLTDLSGQELVDIPTEHEDAPATESIDGAGDDDGALAPDEVCLPDCGQKQCGDDGCDGSCGSCGLNELCGGSGLCVCAELFAPCGGACCSAGEVCANGTCCQPECGPGNECGVDGCGGTCGACSEEELCVHEVCMDASGCAPGKIKSCMSYCFWGSDLGDGFCDFQFKCAEFLWDGGDCTNCDEACDGLDCGNVGDCTCGTCEEGFACIQQQCVPCQPACAGKTCGDDGCGGSCGDCKLGCKKYPCVDDACQYQEDGFCWAGEDCVNMWGEDSSCQTTWDGNCTCAGDDF